MDFSTAEDQIAFLGLFSLQELTLGKSAAELYDRLQSDRMPKRFAEAVGSDPVAAMLRESEIESPSSGDLWHLRNKKAFYRAQNAGVTADEVIAYIERRGYYRIRSEELETCSVLPHEPIWKRRILCGLRQCAGKYGAIVGSETGEPFDRRTTRLRLSVNGFWEIYLVLMLCRTVESVQRRFCWSAPFKKRIVPAYEPSDMDWVSPQQPGWTNPVNLWPEQKHAAIIGLWAMQEILIGESIDEFCARLEAPSSLERLRDDGRINGFTGKLEAMRSDRDYLEYLTGAGVFQLRKPGNQKRKVAFRSVNYCPDRRPHLVAVVPSGLSANADSAHHCRNHLEKFVLANRQGEGKEMAALLIEPIVRAQRHRSEHVIRVPFECRCDIPK